MRVDPLSGVLSGGLSGELVGALLGALLILQSCASSPTLPTPATGLLEELFAEIDDWDQQRSPVAPLYRGEHPQTIAPVSSARFNADADQARRYLEQLDALDSPGLANQQSISLAIMRFKLQDQLDRHEYGAHHVPIDAEGGFYNLAAYTIDRLPFDSADDYAAWLRWLPDYARYLKSHLELMREGVRQSIVAPQTVVTNNLQLLRPIALDDWQQHPDMAPLRAFPASVSSADRARIQSEALELFHSDLRPAYAEVAEFLQGEYRRAAPASPGVKARPNGAAFYANRIRFFTTLTLSADEVFELGEREVARIESQMDDILQQLDYSGSREEFIAEQRTASGNFAESADALLARAAWIAKRIEGQLPRWFDPLYRMPFTIRPVPDDIAPNYTSGRYLSGDYRTRRPGVYWVNTSRLQSRPLFNLPALTLHEAVPGHHLQHAIAAEQTGVPEFRSRYYISAFGEGWGLYAEYLGEEMGIYQTPLEQFGRLSYEMWRACRLVVDVGLHDRGWSRQQAIDYLASRSALSQHEVVNEIDRYIGWPAQALAYKVGELVIKRLRREAERHLAQRFDVRKFHNAVLRNGSLPLPLLIEEVRAALDLPAVDQPVRQWLLSR